MSELENRRKNTDRRINKMKSFSKEQRSAIRRGEDKNNLTAYYITLGSSLTMLIILGIASFIYEGGF